jgi:hypothetical protein
VGATEHVSRKEIVEAIAENEMLRIASRGAN